MSLIKQALEKAEEKTESSSETTTRERKVGASSEARDARRNRSYEGRTRALEHQRSPLNLAVWSLVIFASAFLIGLELAYLFQVYL